VADHLADLAQFRQLCDQKECAAYRVVAAAEDIVIFWESRDPEEAKTLLHKAVREYWNANRRVEVFRQSVHLPPQTEKENQSDGHRSVA